MSTSIFHVLLFFFLNFLYRFTQSSIVMCFVSLVFFILAFSTFYLNLVFVIRNLVFSRLSLVYIQSNYFYSFFLSRLSISLISSNFFKHLFVVNYLFLFRETGLRFYLTKLPTFALLMTLSISIKTCCSHWCQLFAFFVTTPLSCFVFCCCFF